MKAGNWAGLGVLFLLGALVFWPLILASLVCFIGMVVAMQQAHGVAIANAAATPKAPPVPMRKRLAAYLAIAGAALAAVGFLVLKLWMEGEYDHLFY
jgi:hypothetical protein